MTAEKASTIFDRSVGWLLTATGMFLHYQPSEFNSWRRFYLKECTLGFIYRSVYESTGCRWKAFLALHKSKILLLSAAVHSIICLMLLNRICVCV